MSVMVGVKHRGRIAVASDSRWTSGWDHQSNALPKVVKRGSFLLTVGPTAGFEQALWEEVLALAEREPDWPAKWARHCLSGPNESVMRRLAEKHEEPIIVAWAGRLLALRATGSIFETADGIATCGCGGDFARGAAILYRALRPASSARGIAVRGVEVAIECDAGCAGPVVVREMAAPA